MAHGPSQQLQTKDSINFSNNSHSFNRYTNHNSIVTVNTGIDEEKREILQWLSPLEPQQRHQGVRNQRFDGVGDWLLETNEFRRWRDVGAGDGCVQPVLFCHGNPGVGKTFLTSLVIDNLCDQDDERDIAVAGLYCDFHAHQEQSCANMLGAIIKQLVNRGEIPEDVRKAFKKDKKNFGGRGLRIPDLVTMLKKVIASLERVFICIDALDESVPGERLKLLGSLSDVVCDAPNTRIFLTGRKPIQDEINQHFANALMIPISPTAKDIKGYLEKRLQEDPTPKAMDDSLREDIMKIIPESISAIFLLVSLNIEALLGEVTIYRRRNKLQEMITGKGLGDAYMASIERIKAQKGSKSRLGMDVLMWVSHSERPLKTTELCHALGVEKGSTDMNTQNIPAIETLLGCSLGLVTVEESSSTVRLVHLTLQEYLSDNPTLFHSPHSTITEICLTYLNFRCIRDLSPTLRSVPSSTPFARYASCYWGVHAKREITEGAIPLALRLLDGFEDHISAALLLSHDAYGYIGLPGIPTRFTGLHCAAYFGLDEITVVLLNSKEWDINAADWEDNTPILRAAQTGHHQVLKTLLGCSGIRPNIKDSSGRAALSWAAGRGDEEAVRMLLEWADVSPDIPDKRGYTALSRAAMKGHEEVVRMLLERADVDINTAGGEYGDTALSWAAQRGHNGIVQMLLERGDVNLDIVDMFGRTALSLAAQSGHERVVRALLERADVDPNTEGSGYGGTALFQAAGAGHEKVVRMLLKRGDVDPNTVEGNLGQTILSLAAENGHDGIVQMLLERGDVNPNIVDVFGQTALSSAAQHGHERVVKALLGRADVDLNIVDSIYGGTALSWAAGKGHEEVVRMLLERGDVDPNTMDGNFGQTTPSWAAKNGMDGIVQMLLERGDVNPGIVDMFGRTALSLAAQHGHERIVRMLLERADVDPDMADISSPTMLSLAAENEHEHSAKPLLKQKNLISNPTDAHQSPELRSAELSELPEPSSKRVR